ncbi:MAG: 2Fe-2S iron-sulfur cluster-binding protein, partial [Rhodospirillales bacterium]|nr:2Fe-2S iron-sulfur cluster-binding protein [Rhodospirillales bacterium]
MVQPYRLAEGGHIDRERPLGFRFNGKPYEGYAGDTLASALLANGVHLVGRSFKYHRPRGIVSAGAEETNALVQVGLDPRTDPNIRATQLELVDGLTARSQNCWPSVEFDISVVNNAMSRFMPAGFYYKTFMWPAALWMSYEHVIRHAAGIGRAPSEPDPDRYDKTNAHCDVLVVGAGPAGLAAALAAAEAGARVILAEQDAQLGGALFSLADETIDGKPALDWVAETLIALGKHQDVRLLPRTTAFSYYDHNYVAMIERVTDHLDEKPENLPRHRLWKVRAKQVVLATGAIERPLVFADNDRPGIMLADAAQTYLNRFGVKPGNRAVVFTNNDGAYGAALDLHRAGIEVAAIVDLRPLPEGPLSEQAEAAGLPILSEHAIIATRGAKRVNQVAVAQLTRDSGRLIGEGEGIACDLVLSSGGWSPTVHLFSQSKGKIAWNEVQGCFVPDSPAQATHAAGACNGAFGLASCLSQGFAAGEAAAAAAGFKSKAKKTTVPQASDRGILPARWMWHVPGAKAADEGGKYFVDMANDATVADLQLAVREGYRSIEHVKRYTTTGMGTDQGKTGNVNAIGIVAEALGRPLPEVGVTTFRPPYTPVTFGVFAGRDVDGLLDPVRKTPMHAWHERNG